MGTTEVQVTQTPIAAQTDFMVLPKDFPPSTTACIDILHAAEVDALLGSLQVSRLAEVRRREKALETSVFATSSQKVPRI